MLPPVLQDKRGGGSSDGFVARLEPRSWGSRFSSLGSACKGSAGVPKLTGLVASLGWRDGKAGALRHQASGLATFKVCAFLEGSHKSWLSVPLPQKVGTTACTPMDQLLAGPGAASYHAVSESSMASIDLSPVRGTRDFPPERMRLRTWLFEHWRAVAATHGFCEYDAPVVEHEALYVRKAGEEITGQLYNFEDKGGRRLALRPEMTPSLARMLLAQGKSLPLPAKWFSIPQCWRYERMTRGRKREHYQWNMDVIGVAGVEAEAELLAAITTFFQRIGLGPEDIGIKISSRKVLQSVLQGLGVTDEQFAPVAVLVDKLEKMPREAIEADLAKLGLDGGVVDAMLETLSLRSLDDLATALGDDHEVVGELRQLFALAEAYGYAPWLQFDASIVRGLAYYTGVVFEAFDRGATLRAICGGGRYDRLLSTFGGQDIPAAGFGFGDVVVVELLKDKGLLPDLRSGVDDVVFPFGPELRPQAVLIAQQLRAQGRSVDLVLEDRKVKWAFKHADRIGARRMVLIGSREWDEGKVKVKDLQTGEQTLLAPEDL